MTELRRELNKFKALGLEKYVHATELSEITLYTLTLQNDIYFSIKNMGIDFYNIIEVIGWILSYIPYIKLSEILSNEELDRVYMMNLDSKDILEKYSKTIVEYLIENLEVVGGEIQVPKGKKKLFNRYIIRALENSYDTTLHYKELAEKFRKCGLYNSSRFCKKLEKRAYIEQYGL